MMTFREALSQYGDFWKDEIRVRSPMQICKDLPRIVYFTLAIPLAMLYVRVRRLVVICYQYARHYYFVILIDLENGPGTYARLHKERLQEIEWDKKTRKA